MKMGELEVLVRESPLCTYVCMCMYVCIMYVCTYVCVCVYYVCMYVCMYVTPFFRIEFNL
jgi:hypothetical protein